MAYLLVAVVMISTGICFSLARRKGLNAPMWVVLGALFGPLAVPFVMLARARSSAADPAIDPSGEDR